eukprot:4695335-Karenia_brevis.AAC.1
MLEREEPESLCPWGVPVPSDPSDVGLRTLHRSDLDEPVSVGLSISDLAILAQDANSAQGEPKMNETRST